MRVLLSTYCSRGGVEPLVGLAAQLQTLGAEVRVVPAAGSGIRGAAGAYRPTADPLRRHGARDDDRRDAVAAVMHHGGAGTTTTAARAGAPQVVVPQGPDQLYWAGRVADLGIGAARAGPIPTFESLSAALTTALTPETRARASAVAGDIRTDGAMVAATLLIEAISRESPPGDLARPAPPR